MKKIMLLVVSLAFVLLGSGCDQAKNSGLIGKWKSDEQKTLQSMRETPGLSDKARELFEKDFFGKLTVEFREETARAQFDNSEDNVEEMNEYQPYKVLEVTDEYYLVESYDLVLQKNDTKKLYKDGDCFYMLVSQWEFKEYFCRLR